MPRNITVLVLFLVTPFARARPPAYYWPLDAPPALTSSFAEFRHSWNFHAGIDLKTWGKSGYKVFAVADGYVWRIRVSPYGYGKAVYLKANNYQPVVYVVYAHLSGFNQAIRERVEQEQQRRGSFRVDLYLKEGEMPVSRGDCLGYSGRSGILHPHLHFEIRDALHRPLNPQLHGFTVKDTSPPRLTRLTVVPLDMYSTVGRDFLYRIYPFTANDQQDCFELPQMVTASGCIGLGIDCYDLADEAPNVMNPYRLELLVDDTLRFSTTYRQFTYDETSQIRLDRDYQIWAQGQGIFQRLYCVPGNGLSFYTFADSLKGVLCADSLGAGRHAVTLRVGDAAGNYTTGQVSLVFNQPPAITGAAHPDDSTLVITAADPDDSIASCLATFSLDNGKKWRPLNTLKTAPGSFKVQLPSHSRPGLVSASVLDTWQTASFPFFYYLRPDSGWPATDSIVISDTFTYYNDFTAWELTITPHLPDLPLVTMVRSGLKPDTLTVATPELSHYRVLVPLSGTTAGPLTLFCRYWAFGAVPRLLSRPLPVYPVSPASIDTLTLEDSTLQLSWGKSSVYDTIYLRTSRDTAVSGDDSLPCLSDRYNIKPSDIPLHQGLTVGIRIPASITDYKRLGLYVNTGPGNWAFLSNTVDSEKRVVLASVRRLGSYALLEDRVPPVIANLSVADRDTIYTDLPLLTAEAYDVGSGFNDYFIVLKLDGQSVIFEWDPPIRLISYQVKEPLATGPHRLSITVEDQAGNRTDRKIAFFVKGP